MLPKPFRRIWDLLGVASDLQGRLTIVALLIGGLGVVLGTTVAQSVLLAAGLLAIALGIILLLAGHWHLEKRAAAALEAAAGAWTPPVDPESFGKYLNELNDTMERHGFGRNPNLPAPSAVDTGWFIRMGVSTPPKGRRPTLSISVYSKRGTAPEELQCVVVDPSGSYVIGHDRARILSQGEPSSRLHVMYPWEFAGAEMEWPPMQPGTYRVIAQAVRADERGMVPHDVAYAEFVVSSEGDVALPNQKEASPISS